MAMATLDYIAIPACASRIQSLPQLENSDSIQFAPKLRTSLPRPSPESIEGPTSPSKGFAASSTFNLLPQILLSSSLPSGSFSASDASSPNDSKSNLPRKRLKNRHQEPVVLLTNRDPLAIQITTVNFKRFIERVGPVFWLQDRIEEILFWRRGPKLTGAWLAAYGFLCYFPRLLFVLPHLILIVIMLASIRYPIRKPPPLPVSFLDSSASSSTEPTSDAEMPLPPPAAEDSVDWQANIQAIQNLMGFYADIHVAITPYLSHLSLSPNNPQLSNPGPKSVYTLPLLTILILTLPLSIYLVTSAYFPARLVCFICGAGPVILLNPHLRRWYSELVRLHAYLRSPLPNLVYPSATLYIPLSIRVISTRLFGFSLPSQLTLDAYLLALLRKRVKTRLQRLIDNNNLSDQAWNSEMREVELWENERLDPASSSQLLGSPTMTRIASPPPSYTKEDSTSTFADKRSPPRPPPVQQHQRSRSSFFGTAATNSGWSKSHLKSNDRTAWTRGQDGWSGVPGSDGTVSSNLTFSLAPNWEFVPTEDWRVDLVGNWVKEKGDDDHDGAVPSVLGADENGWVYTNDVWLVPADHPYSGAVTRRRRWVRRIWYNSGT